MHTRTSYDTGRCPFWHFDESQDIIKDLITTEYGIHRSIISTQQTKYRGYGFVSTAAVSKCTITRESWSRPHVRIE